MVQAWTPAFDPVLPRRIGLDLAPRSGHSSRRYQTESTLADAVTHAFAPARAAPPGQGPRLPLPARAAAWPCLRRSDPALSRRAARRAADRGAVARARHRRPG